MKIEDVVMDMGAKIRDTQVMFDDEVLKTVSSSNYDYKTGLPEFVDSIALPRIQQAMDKLRWKYETVFYIDGIRHEMKKWGADDGVEIEAGSRTMKINKKYFRKLYNNRDREVNHGDIK